METDLNFLINLHPMAWLQETPISLVKQGNMLIVNGEDLDLGFLGEGDTISAQAVTHPLLNIGTIQNTGGVVELAVVFPISPDLTSPESCYPEPILVTEDGPISLPPQFPPQPEDLPEDTLNEQDNFEPEYVGDTSTEGDSGVPSYVSESSSGAGLSDNPSGVGTAEAS